MPTFPTVQQLKNAKVISLGSGETKSPPSNKTWVILNGGLSHVTGTTSTFLIYSDKTPQNALVLFRTISASGNATSMYPLFPTLADKSIGQYMGFIVVHDTFLLKFNGGTGAKVNLMVVEI